MMFAKCPRCDLNYITASERYCKVCMREMKGDGAQDEIEMCSVCSENPALPEYPVRPPCNEGENVENGSIGEMEEHCGGCANMPSLAMVYAPKQCWRKVFKPEDALMHGSQFAELVLPLEVVGNGKFCEWGVNTCK